MAFWTPSGVPAGTGAGLAVDEPKLVGQTRRRLASARGVQPPGTVGWRLRSGPLPGVAGPAVVFGVYMMFWFGNGMSGWGYGLMAAGMVVFWALVVLGVVGLFRYLARVDRSVVTRPTAEQVLAERFARGDIDEPQYRQRLDVLRGGVGVRAAP